MICNSTHYHMAFLCLLPCYLLSYLLPINKQAIPKSTNKRSMALERKFFSLKIIAPNKKETITLPRRTIETIAIIAPGHDKA